LRDSLPLLLALVGFFNTSIKNYQARAILPYCQALCKFVPHIQQLDMESNGKRVNLDGHPLDYECTVVNFGEPGTNGKLIKIKEQLLFEFFEQIILTFVPFFMKVNIVSTSYCTKEELSHVSSLDLLNLKILLISLENQWQVTKNSWATSSLK